MAKVGFFVMVFLLAIDGCSKKSSGNDPAKPLLSIGNVEQARDNSSRSHIPFRRKP